MSHLRRVINSHVLVVAFLVGLFAAVMTGLQLTLARAEASVRDALTVMVFLQNTTTDSEANQLVQSLKAQDPEIQSVTYTSKDQAYQMALQDPNLAKSLMLLKANPLPASLAIRYSDRAWWERSEPTENLKSLAAIQDIRWDAQARSLFQTLRRWRRGCMRFSVFILILLGSWALIGLYRFISLHSALPDMATQLGIGLVGGALAWSLWGLGLHAIQADLSPLHPVWIWIVPMVLGAVAALACYGVDIRHAE